MCASYHESCWGCGFDYLAAWTERELIPVLIDKTDRAKVCPYCYEELAETNRVSIY